MKPITGRKLCKLVEKLGFELIRIRGSHHRYKHFDGRLTTVPVHGNEEIGRGLLLEILKQIKITKEKYNKMRKGL